MRRTRLLLSLLACLGAAPAAAQLESPLLSKIQLNLVNPGGKSLAMGGAFTALADDATGAIANPAGLPQLSAWQFGASGKSFRFSPELGTGTYVADSSGVYARAYTDTYRPRGAATDLEFASLVGPLGEGVSVALYRAVNLRYRLTSDDLAGGSYRAFALVRPPFSATTLDEAGGLDLRSEVWGASLGLQLGALSLGGGVTLSRLRYDLLGPSSGGGHLFTVNREAVPGAPGYQPRFDATVSADVAAGSRLGWLAGLRWQVLEVANVVVGAVYRRSPSFPVKYSVSALYPASGARVSFSCGVDDPAVPGSGASACGSFKVPDDWSAGVSASPVPNLLVSAEIQRVYYSQLQDGFVPLFVYCRSTVSPCPVQDRAVAGATGVDVTIPRLGVEWTIPTRSTTQVAVRAGWHREPAHAMKVQLYPDADRDRRPDPGPPIEVTQPPLSDAYRTTYDGGVSENHWSFGTGLTLGRRLSIDLAADFAPSGTSLVISAFYRF